jgi:hypothetical protein
MRPAFTRVVFSTLHSDLGKLLPGSFRHIKELFMTSENKRGNKRWLY